MADWKTLIHENLDPERKRDQHLKQVRPVHYHKIEWGDKTNELHQQKQAISQQLTTVRAKIQELKTDINTIDRFLTNPFTDKRMSSEQRKAAWLKAADKKKALEKTLSETVKIWNALTLEEKVTKQRRSK